MSRSTDATTGKLENPAKLFLQWSGSVGKFSYFDKTKGESGEKVFMDIPMKFVAIDTLSTIKGYSKKHKNGIWSNEVRDINKDILTARTRVMKGGEPSDVILGKGLYKEIKDSIKGMGGKFSQSVYALIAHEGKPTFANIQMFGSALSPWIDFTKSNDIYKIAVEITGSTDGGDEGGIQYKVPVFAKAEASEASDKAAKELDTVLKEYLTKYFARQEEFNKEALTK